MLKKLLRCALPLATCAFLNQSQAADLAQQAQNPISDLMSLPLQNNTSFNYGPLKKSQNVLNIQPVIPITLNENWNLVTRTILPVISQPAFFPADARKNGIGDIQFTAFFVSSKASSVTFGFGPVLQLPTASSRRLGARLFALGPSFVVVATKKNWVFGGLINNITSFDRSSLTHQRVNAMLIQPFLNYNFPSGWYLTSSPIITANWVADRDNRWIVPIGGGIGKVFKIGRQNLNASLQSFYNVEHPTFGPTWSIRFQLQFLFPRAS